MAEAPTHLVLVEPPDIFLVRFAGHVSGADVDRILDRFEDFAKGPGPAYQLLDVSRFVSATPDARRAAAVRRLPPTYAGLVIFGGTFQQQLVAKLATTAGWLLRGRALGKPMPAVVKDEPAARAWVEERRRNH